jgi:hypothetical protein
MVYNHNNRKKTSKLPETGHGPFIAVMVCAYISTHKTLYHKLNELFFRLSERLQKVFSIRNEKGLEIIEGDLVVVNNKKGAYYRAEVLDIFKVNVIGSYILFLPYIK